MCAEAKDQGHGGLESVTSELLWGGTGTLEAEIQRCSRASVGYNPTLGRTIICRQRSGSREDPNNDSEARKGHPCQIASFLPPLQ